MCLHALTQEYNKTSGRIHVGYKFFQTPQTDVLMFPYHYILKGVGDIWSASSKIVPLGTWVKATSRDPEYRIPTSEDFSRKYRPGFHILKTLRAAKAMEEELGFPVVVKKIYFRNVTAKGYELLSKSRTRVQTLVAQELFVPKEGQEDVVPV